MSTAAPDVLAVALHKAGLASTGPARRRDRSGSGAARSPAGGCRRNRPKTLDALAHRLATG